MIKYVLNLEELYVGLQEELKKWSYELDVSSLKVAHTNLKKGTHSEIFSFNKGVQIKDIMIHITNPSNVGDLDKIVLQTNKSKMEYNIQKVKNLSLVKGVKLSENYNDNFNINLESIISGDYEIHLYIIYTEEVETQFYFINMRCFYEKDLGVFEELGTKTKIVPFNTTKILAPKILGYEAVQPEIEVELRDEKTINIDVEYMFKQSFGQPLILSYLIKNNKETDYLLMKKYLGDIPFGVFIYAPDEFLFEGRYVLDHPTEIAETIDFTNRKPIYKVFYQEVS